MSSCSLVLIASSSVESVHRLGRCAFSRSGRTVGEGSGNCRREGPSAYTNGICKGQGGGVFHTIAGEMLKQRFSPDEIGKMEDGNFRRVFENVRTNAAPEACISIWILFNRTTRQWYTAA